MIALAMSSNPQRIVLHQETGGSLKSPKIPFACEAEGVKQIDLLALIDQEG